MTNALYFDPALPKWGQMIQGWRKIARRGVKRAKIRHFLALKGLIALKGDHLPHFFFSKVVHNPTFGQKFIP